MTGKPLYLNWVTHSCDALSHIIAGVHYFFHFARVLKQPAHLSTIEVSRYKSIQNIWCTRITRRVVSVLVRSPLRASTLRLVHFTDKLPSGSGCIIVTCHTPWKRLIVQWCLEHKMAIFVSQGVWTHRKRSIQRQGLGVSDLRKIIQHLQQNGRVIIAGDIFNQQRDCPVTFFENTCNASLFPVRLARQAKIPLITALPVLRNGEVHIDYGPRFSVDELQISDVQIMQQLISFFEEEIRREPGIYPALAF